MADNDPEASSRLSATVFATARQSCFTPINTCRDSAASPVQPIRTSTASPTSISDPQSRKALSNGWLPTAPDKSRRIPLQSLLDRTCRPSEIQPIQWAK